MKMNIFFILISSVLLSIFVLFKPIDIQQQKFEDVPLFNISSFIIYELDKHGLSSLTSGVEAARYADRYTVKFMDYTDNTKKYIANMKANDGIYKNNIIYLFGDVVYFREDGLTFETQKAVYNKKTTIAQADGDYVLYEGTNKVVGKKLIHNNSLDTIQSKDVVVKYQLKGSKE